MEHIGEHADCSCSTGIHETSDDDGSPEYPWALTFGRGKLDDHGYWEIPCAVCARKAELKDEVPVGSYWPFLTTAENTKMKETTCKS